MLFTLVSAGFLCLALGKVLIKAPWGENLVLKAGQTVTVDYETSSIASIQLLQVYSPLRQDPIPGAVKVLVKTSGKISYDIPRELPKGPQLYAFKITDVANPMEEFTYSVNFKIDAADVVSDGGKDKVAPDEPIELPILRPAVTPSKVLSGETVNNSESEKEAPRSIKNSNIVTNADSKPDNSRNDATADDPKMLAALIAVVVSVLLF